MLTGVALLKVHTMILLTGVELFKRSDELRLEIGPHSIMYFVQKH